MSRAAYRDLKERLLFNSVAFDGGYVTECWAWIGSLNTKEYGRLSVWVGGKYRKLLAHRVSFTEFKGELIPPKYDVDHKCQNSWCIAPDHLQAIPIQRNRGYYVKYRSSEEQPALEGVT